MRGERVERDGRCIVVGPPGEPWLRGTGDLPDLVELCIEQSARGVLAHEANLPARFFELRSGEAGEVLQKLRNYGIRLAAVVTSASAEGGHVGEMVGEEARGGAFRVFRDRESAEDWLLLE